MIRPGGPIRLGSYEQVAAEYYDAARHPTCANFRQASQELLERLVPSFPSEQSCEVGAGDAILAKLLSQRGCAVRGLLLTDASKAMLGHSHNWERLGAIVKVARADELPVGAASLQLLVASLGDPYDDDSFWSEVARVLASDGRCVLTTPSWTWAARFRRNRTPVEGADFELRDGTRLNVPSLIRPPAEEHRLIERHGLQVLEQEAILAASIDQPVSAKLQVLDPDDPVVVGYVVAAGA